MAIQIKYFASLREKIGRDQDQIEADEPLTVLEVWQRATETSQPANILCAINMDYANWTDTVNPNDEVAFFPPVTGG
jgi:molybdopterin synthase sulfur carrier subunit